MSTASRSHLDPNSSKRTGIRAAYRCPSHPAFKTLPTAGAARALDPRATDTSSDILKRPVNIGDYPAGSRVEGPWGATVALTRLPSVRAASRRRSTEAPYPPLHDPSRAHGRRGGHANGARHRTVASRFSKVWLPIG